MSSTFYTNSCNTTNFKSGTCPPDEPVFQTIIKEQRPIFITMTFSEFKQTPFYTWYKNFLAQKLEGESLENMMIDMFNLSFRDEMMTHFEENRALYK